MANRSGVSSQNISRTDILAEGPVRGLKNGSSSIFFNDVASEDANVRGYNPVEGTASGKITFDEPETRRQGAAVGRWWSKMSRVRGQIPQLERRVAGGGGGGEEI